jgi:uncharacterized membrane protein YoaK (UPF0700 family)
VSTEVAPHLAIVTSGAQRTLRLGVSLAAVGGFLDAFTYVGLGHVFANAMSGNIVLTALSLQAGDLNQAFRTLSALGAFMVGVIVANALRLPRVSRVIRRPAVFALIVEAALLVMIGSAPHAVPAESILLAVTFVSAVQTSTFRQLADWTFTSTMTTGNLRSLADALLDWATGRERTHARKARHFAAVCFAFFAGAVIGGVSTHFWGTRAAWVVAVLVVGCIILMAPLTFPKTRGTMRGVTTAKLSSSQEETA